MQIPVQFMKMDLLRWLNSHRCKHNHTYLSHFSCYKEEIVQKNVGYFDIETSNLKADFGVVLCWHIIDKDDNIYGRVATSKEILGAEYPDKALMEELVEVTKNFDLLYGYYSTRFDLPFCRTRCLMMGIDFPHYGALKHKDIYYIIRNKFALHRKTQEVAAEMLLGSTNKTHWSAKHWIRAVQGNQESLDYIDKHCLIDCKELKAISELVLDYSQPTERSV